MFACRLRSASFASLALHAMDIPYHRKGMAISSDRLPAITEMKRPASKEEVRHLLGLVAYVAKFLP